MSDMQNNLFGNLQGNPNQPTSLMATSSNPLFNDSTTNKGLFWIIKIILMFINAFTGMIGIFIVLFGFAYPEERFPGDLKGKTCALLSIVYIIWTGIGYCGAHHQKFSFLLVYSGLVVFYVFANIVFGVLAPKPWLDVNLFWIMCAYFTCLMAIGLLHAYQIRLKEERNDDPMGYGYNQGLNYGSTYANAYIAQMPAQYTNQAMPTQMPLYAPANQLQAVNSFANNFVDASQMYNMQQQPATTYVQAANYAEPSTSGSRGSGSGMNYFQRSWNRMSSKRMGNLFNRANSTYRPNENIITEMKPMTFNTSTMHPY